MKMRFIVMCATLSGFVFSPFEVMAFSCDRQCDQEPLCLFYKNWNCNLNNPPSDGLIITPPGSSTPSPVFKYPSDGFNAMPPGFSSPFPGFNFPPGGFDVTSPAPSSPAPDDSASQKASQGLLGVRASRAFAGPGQYPPRGFAAYGIVAFKALSYNKKEKQRYLNICKGYLAAVPESKKLLKRIPLNEQMVTIWPLNKVSVADELNAKGQEYNEKICEKAVSAIDLLASLDAIKAAGISKSPQSFKRSGPYVIAWSPAHSFGTSGSPVLTLDLSGVSTAEHATKKFQEWAREIEIKPELWSGGWNYESLRDTIRSWADRWGPMILSILSKDSWENVGVGQER